MTRVLVDVVETIYLECLWQMADPVYKDKSLFGFPLTVWIRHPLRFVVGHVQHGQQLRSAWTTRTPESIKDRDENLGNMSIESAIENYAKSNLPNDSYPLILAKVRAVKLSSEYYDAVLGDEAKKPEDLEQLDFDLQAALEDRVAEDDGIEAEAEEDDSEDDLQE